jgi:hypothetical protein
MDKYIIIVYDNYIYKIEKEPFETDENTYRRGWFIIKNQDKDNYEETVLKSIIYLNENKNKMKY